MEQYDYYWSAKARLEFASIFDDGHYTDAFQRAVAEAFAKGWSGNRDKPIWAMAVAARAIARAAAVGTAFQSTGSAEDGLDLVWADPKDVLQGLLSLQGDDLSDINCTIEPGDGGFVLKTPDGHLRLTVFRLSVLKKLAELLLAANDFAFAQAVMGQLSAAAQAESFAGIKAASREISKIAYQYRTEHIKDAHAGSGFSIVRNFLAARGYTIEDDTVFEFWVDPENQKYQTYEACFRAFAAFVDAMQSAEAINAAHNAADIFDPIVAGDVATPAAFGDDFSAEPPLDDGSAAQEADSGRLAPFAVGGLATAGNDNPGSSGEGDGDDAGAGALAPDILSDKDFRLLNQREVTLLSRIFEVGTFGRGLTLATLRLISFHAVQSGLSNGLRTGRWKVPIDERVKCIEAQAYSEIRKDIEELETKMTQLLEAAFACVADPSAVDETAEAAVRQGQSFIVKSRSKSMDKSPEELREAFLNVTPVLIAAREAASALSSAVSNRERSLAATAVQVQSHSSSNALDCLFEEDRPKFANEYARRYADHLGANDG